MSYNITETQQIEELKKLWKEYGIAIVAGILIALAIVLGWHFYKSYKTKQAYQSSMLFQDVMVASANGDIASEQDKANKLKEQYPSSAYAAFGALTLAQLNVEKNDLSAAEKNLLWVISHTKVIAIRNIAQIRLARIYIANKQDKKVLKILNSIHNKVFNAAIYEVMGDLYLKNNDKVLAKKYYKKASTSLKKNEISHPLLEMKLQSLV